MHPCTKRASWGIALSVYRMPWQSVCSMGVRCRVSGVTLMSVRSAPSYEYVILYLWRPHTSAVLVSAGPHKAQLRLVHVIRIEPAGRVVVGQTEDESSSNNSVALALICAVGDRQRALIGLWAGRVGR